MTQNKSTTFIAIGKNDNVMGFVNLYPSFSTLSLEKILILNDLAVSREYQGRGVAQVLIQEAINFSRKSDVIRIELKTEVANTHAQRLYAKIGFKIDEDNVYYRVPVTS